MADYTQPDDVAKRVRFFDGQFLQDQDLIDEQKYHLDRERRTLREFGVPGVLTGLQVTTSAPYEMTISTGTAVDALGRFIVLDEPLVLTFPKNNVTQAFPVSIMYREVESDIATTGGQSATRWDESPMAGAALPDGTAVVAPSDAPTTWDDPVVGLGSWVITNGSFVASSAPEAAAGLRVPGSLDGSGLRIGAGSRIGLVVDANGQVGVGTEPDNHFGFQQLLDVAGASNANLTVRTLTVDSKLIASDAGYWQAPAGQVVGTGSNHPVTIATQAAPRLTVAANGDVGVGATAPENAEQWNRTLDVYAYDNVKLSVRTAAIDGRVMAHNEGKYGTPPGQIIGVTTNHAVSLVTQAKARLTVTGAGNLGIGTVTPATTLDLLGTLQVTAPSSLDTGPALFVDPKGQVGIGTTTPENAEAWYRTLDLSGATDAKLSVRAAGIDTRIMVHNGGMYGAPAGQIIGTKTNHPVSLVTNATARMIVSQTGNVGIGTLTPATALDLRGTLQATGSSSLDTGPALYIDAKGQVGIGTTTPENAEAWYRTLDLSGTQNAKLSVRAAGIDTRIMVHNTGMYGAPAGQIIGTKTNHPVSLITNATPRMFIGQNGNVGIGTTNPTATLQVTGTMQVFPADGTIAAPALLIDAKGQVGVGTAAVENGDGWVRVLDVHGDPSAKVSVRTDAVDGRIMAHNGGFFGAPGGQIIGTASSHPLTLATSGKARLVVTQTGVVGIGTMSPSANGAWPLAPNSSYDEILDLYGNDRVQLRMHTSTIDAGFAVNPLMNWTGLPGLASYPAISGLALGTWSNHFVSIFCNGGTRLGITNLGISVVGSVYYSGSLLGPSDARLKTDVTELEDALGAIGRLRGVRFAWTEEALRDVLPGASRTRQVGVIAQDVAEVLPELVTTDGSGLLAVDYSKLTAVLVQAVKELEGRLALLETKADR
ncbi:hypothetical protein GCM10023322_55690 [Rugosimonospora acidiphila]|uniref:Peptidase S74 domain-containing protein n=1 Tax=Rugosimonospora acidiphila TaxID=556531 RepID=A0ABP9SAL7_9ACTN